MIDAPFSGLPSAAARALVDASRPRSLAADEVLYREGDVGETLCLVSGGLLAAEVDRPERPVTVAVIGLGHLVGEMAVFARRPRRFATVVARTASRVLELDAPGFSALRAAHPSVSDLFLQVLAERSATLSARLGDLSQPLSVRVCRRLLELPEPGRPGDPVPVTARDLADLCGETDVELAEQVLVRLAAEGSIRWAGGVTLLDRPAVAGAALLP